MVWIPFLSHSRSFIYSLIASLSFASSVLPPLWSKAAVGCWLLTGSLTAENENEKESGRN